MSRDNAGSLAASAPAVVDDLRSGLARDQRALLEALPSAGEAAPTTRPDVYLGRLRTELRINILSIADASGSLDLAVKRAAIRDTLFRIDAYETAYGLQDGARTTRLNVLSTSELKFFGEQLRQVLRGLLGEAAPLPSDSTPLSLRGRINEVRAELDGIVLELASRAERGPSKLVSIAAHPTAPDAARALEIVRMLDGPEGSRLAERALLIEIEERLAWKPNDAALREARTRVTRQGGGKALLAAARDAAGDGGWPPRRGPPGRGGPDGSALGRGPNGPPPPGTPGPGAVAELRLAAADEIKALIGRNPRAAGDSSARMAVAAEWVGELVGVAESGTSPFEMAAISMSSEELESHRAVLEQWERALLRERAVTDPASWHGDPELHDTEQRLKILASEISIRGPPPPGPEVGPHGPQAMERAVDLSSERMRVVPFQEYAELAVEHRRLVELQKRLPLVESADRPAIETAVAEQKARRLEVEARAINRAYSDAVAAEKRALVLGRGPDGARSAVEYRRAQHALRWQADAVRSLAQSYMNSGQVARGRLSNLTLVPPGGTGGGIAEFDPGLLTRLASLDRGMGTPTASQSIAGSGRVAELGERVAVSGRMAVLAERAPDSLKFGKSFPEFGINSARELLSDPFRAPGGIIVDLKLPDAIAAELVAVAYDPALRQFRLNIGNRWVAVEPKIGPETARAALGFVYDGRVVAVDIGPFDPKVATWLAGEGLLKASTLMTIGEKATLLDSLRLLRIVRTNPAVRHTVVSPSLIAADELIFSALSLSDVLLASDSVFRGLDTRDLHLRLKRDRAALKITRGAFKSILTATELHVRRGPGVVHLDPIFDYAVFDLPHRLEEVSRWFSEHDTELRAASPELRELHSFAVAVSILRTVLARELSDGVADINQVVDPGDPTPSLICRSELPNKCTALLITELIATSTEGRDHP